MRQRERRPFNMREVCVMVLLSGVGMNKVGTGSQVNAVHPLRGSAEHLIDAQLWAAKP